MLNWNLQATWDGSYRFDVGHPRPAGTPGVYLHYNRTMLAPLMQNRAARLVSTLGLTMSDTVVIVGGGYGWLAEALADQVPGISTLTMETSMLIQLRKDFDEESEVRLLVQDAGWADPDTGLGASIVAKYGRAGPRTKSMLLDVDTKTGAGRDAVGRPSWVVTEEVLPCIDDADASALVAQCAMFPGAQVAHIASSLMHPTTEGYGTDMNWKTPSAWKDMVGSQRLLVPNDDYREV